MNVTDGPVALVVDLLQSSGYAVLPTPIAVGGVPFDFDAVLVGNRRAFDLVVVADTVLDKTSRLRQKVEALARALDIVGSHRPLTLVTVGPPPSSVEINEISRVCRVLAAPTSASMPEALHDALAVLLPITPPPTSDGKSSPIEQLESWLSTQRDRSHLRELLDSTAKGSEGVTDALLRYLRAPLAGLSKDAE